MKLFTVLLALIILYVAYRYFSKQKYIELDNDEKEDFKNIMIYKYDNFNV